MKQFVFEFVIDYELKIRTIWPPRLPNILKISFDNAEWLLLLFQLYDCCCCFRCTVVVVSVVGLWLFWLYDCHCCFSCTTDDVVSVVRLLFEGSVEASTHCRERLKNE